MGDLDEYPREVVVEPCIRRAAHPPPTVNGTFITRGALGLILSYHTILVQIAQDQHEDHVYVIAEDDASLNEDFVPRFRACVDAATREDAGWHLLHIGYYDDDCNLSPLE